MKSPILFADKVASARKPLHIINTDFLNGNEVLAYFSDGTTAVYEAEELEKLRPAPKHATSAKTPDDPALYATAS